MFRAILTWNSDFSRFFLWAIHVDIPNTHYLNSRVEWEHTVWHRKCTQGTVVSWRGRKPEREWVYVHVGAIISAVQQKLTHYTATQFSSVQSLSRVRLFVTPWTAACQVSLSITNSQSLPKLMSIESVMPSNHLILCCPLLLLPSIFPNMSVFSNKSVLYIRWPKYWSFTFSPSKEHPGLISLRTDWLDLLAVQGTRKSLLQHHSSKASILLHSAFFIVQLSHPYMTTGKTIALTRWTFKYSKCIRHLIYAFLI